MCSATHLATAAPVPLAGPGRPHRRGPHFGPGKSFRIWGNALLSLGMLSGSLIERHRRRSPAGPKTSHRTLIHKHLYKPLPDGLYLTFWLPNCQTHCTTIRQSCRRRVANRSGFWADVPTREGTWHYWFCSLSEWSSARRGSNGAIPAAAGTYPNGPAG